MESLFNTLPPLIAPSILCGIIRVCKPAPMRSFNVSVTFTLRNIWITYCTTVFIKISIATNAMEGPLQ